MGYKELTTTEGIKFIPKVWNFFFRPLSDDNFFVGPFGNEHIADCAEFKIRDNHSLAIYFFISDEKMIDFLSHHIGQMYLYGAYNQVNVCQMRAKGSITQEDNYSDIESIKNRLREKIIGRTKTQINKLFEEEAEERLEILNNGKLFCFHPESYYYDTYERG